MKKKYSPFYSILTLVAVFLILVALLYLSLITPYISEQFKVTVTRQATISADHLFSSQATAFNQRDYSPIAQYGIKMIKENPDIDFIWIEFYAGPNIVITADNWRKQSPIHHNKQGQKEQQSYRLLYGPHALSENDIFSYSKKFTLSNQEPVNMVLGIKDSNYKQYMSRSLGNILGMGSIIILAALFALFLLLSYLRKQISGIQQGATALAAGDPLPHMPANNIIEIDDLICSLNKIVADIDSKKNKIDLLTNIVEQDQDAIVVFDNKQTIKFTNLAFKVIVKKSQHDAVVGKNFKMLLQEAGFMDSDIYEISNNILARNWSWHSEICTKSHPLEERYFNVRIGRLNSPVDYCYIIIRDITQRKIFEQELSRLAFYDKLTKLPNRRLFLDRLEHTINISKRQGFKFILMFMDLDNFKHINDSLGHDYGDKLLQAIATRLTEILRQEDTVCRLGGDEFTIILNNIADLEKAGKIAEKIIESIKKPYYFKDKELSIGVSIGIVNYPDDAKGYIDLMKKADLAMYQAKRAGKNRFFFYKKRPKEDK